MCEFKPEPSERGYFEIGIYHPKTEANVGTLWRSAYQLGAAGIFTIGKRYRPQASDTAKAYKHIPFREYDTFEQFQEIRPRSSILVGIEMGGRKLNNYQHPTRALYLLGAEDHGLPNKIIQQCNHVLSLEAVRTMSFNVTVAGSLIMYDRMFK